MNADDALSFRAFRRLCLAVLVMLMALSTPGSGCAAELTWDGAHDRDLSAWEFQYIPFTLHRSYDPEHEYVWLVGVAKIRQDGWLAGGAYFSNSFGQPCGYGFVGRKYVEPWGWNKVYWMWTAGVLYGYKPPYDHKVPLVVHGFSPGFVPTIGYQVTPRVALQAAALGTSALMFGVVIGFDQAGVH